MVLPYRYANLTGPQRDQIEPENRRWIEEHLTEIVPRRAGLAAADYFEAGAVTWVGYKGSPTVDAIVSFFYRCDWYDPDTRECRAHDQRPPICSGFPWYGDRPDPLKAMPPECGYLVDVGREPVPVEPPTRKRVLG